MTGYNQTATERRNAHRFAGLHRVAVTVIGEPNAPAAESSTFFCSTEDISASGLRFNSNVPLHVGQQVDLLVVLGWAYWGFHLKGRIVWVKGKSQAPRYTMGIQFVETPRGTQIAWDEAISREIPQAQLKYPSIPPQE